MSPVTARNPHEDDRVDEVSADAGETVGALLTEIDHVAIAVHDLDAAIDTTARPSAPIVEHREVVESDGVEEALLKVADSYIQLLTPTRDDSPVAKYLGSKGEGLHHVGYRVDDCGGRARGGQGAGPQGDRRGAAAGVARHDRRLRPPEGRSSAPSSSSSRSSARRAPGARLGHR